MKKFASNFKLGISSYRSALKLINKESMWGYFLLPLGFSLILSIIMYFVRKEIHENINLFLSSLINYESWWEWAQWLTGWIIDISLFVLSWYLYLKIQKYILFIILSPVLAYLSEKTEQKLTGRSYPFNFNQFTKDVYRGILIALRNFAIEIGLLIILFLLGLVPFLTPLTGIAALIVGWYFYGYSVMDYTNERKKLNIQQSDQTIKSKSGLAIANGMIFELIFIIPILGFVIAPILSTVAATIAMHEHEEDLAL